MTDVRTEQAVSGMPNADRLSQNSITERGTCCRGTMLLSNGMSMSDDTVDSTSNHQPSNDLSIDLDIDMA